MPGYTITCPYCFQTFKDDEVHFRMETVLTEDDLDPRGMKRSKKNIEDDSAIHETQKKGLLMAYDMRARFLPKEDQKYKFFWQKFGGTTEIDTNISMGSGMPSVRSYQKVVLDPWNPRDKALFMEEPHCDADNFVIYVVDTFGNKTSQRVCPHCHNPLGSTYGKHPVRFISVIGVSGAGKTVYLSQLSRYLGIEFAPKMGISVVPANKAAEAYCKSNSINIGKALPKGTAPGLLLQPLFFNLIWNNNDKIEVNMIVLYDIAGENCVDPDKLSKFGPFIERSDGVILLIDPGQLSADVLNDEIPIPTKVLQSTVTVMANVGKDTNRIPFAICISKGDTVVEIILEEGRLASVIYLEDENGMPLSVFNEKEHEKLQTSLTKYIKNNHRSLYVHLNNLHKRNGLFLVSALGCDAEKLNPDDKSDKAPKVPIDVPSPKRIEEPFFWMLNQLGYIGTNGAAAETEGWECPVCHASDNRGQYCHNCGQDVFRTSHRRNARQWQKNGWSMT